MRSLSKKHILFLTEGAVLIVLLIILIRFTGKKETVYSEETAAGRAYISAEAAKDPAVIQARIQTLKESAGNGIVPGSASFDELFAQIDSLQIRTLSTEEIYNYRSAMANTVIVGDSMAQAVLEYDLLDENHVYYQRSASISQLDEQITGALSMLPQNLVFFMGLNDINYYEDTSQYYNAFYEKIRMIREIAPDVRIFICSMLPPSDGLAAEREDLARSPEYDAVLRQLCQDVSAGYIDCSWMVRQPLYLEDGIHFSYEFYCVWLQYLYSNLALF